MRTQYMICRKQIYVQLRMTINNDVWLESFALNLYILVDQIIIIYIISHYTIAYVEKFFS